MRYLLLIAEEEARTPPTDADWARMMDEYGAYTTWLKERGWYGGGEALQPALTATTVSVRDGQRLVDVAPQQGLVDHAELAPRTLLVAGERPVGTAGHEHQLASRERSEGRQA